MAIVKSRLRVFGKRVAGTDEIDNVILDLFKNGITKPSEIAKIIGKDRTSVWRSFNRLEAKNLLQKAESGHIIKNGEIKQAEEYRILSNDAFLQTYPRVKAWVDDMHVRKNGKSIMNWKELLWGLKAVCDTLKINPDRLLVKHEGRNLADEYMKSFALQHPKGFKNYVKAVRNFCMYHGIVWARGVSGVMSGTKENVGKYAGVKLSDEELYAISDYLLTNYDLDASAFFDFSIETFARPEKILEVTADQITFKDHHAELRIFETKTSKSFPKFIIDPKRLDRIRRLAEERKGNLLFRRSDREYQDLLREAYKAIGKGLKDAPEDQYFMLRPRYALRHSGAHLWLRRTHYNYGVVASMGWESIDTLRQWYGEMPFEFLMSEIKKVEQ